MLRAVLTLVVAGLTAWLAAAAMDPGRSLPVRGLLWLVATLLPLHLVLWHLGGIKSIDRLPRRIRPPIALVALAASPMVLYPVGLIAVAASFFTGGAATPALAVSGVLMLSPIIAIVAIGLMFALSRHKGG